MPVLIFGKVLAPDNHHQQQQQQQQEMETEMDADAGGERYRLAATGRAWSEKAWGDNRQHVSIILHSIEA